MNRHQPLKDQLKKAIEDFENAQKLEKLSKSYREIHQELKEKVDESLSKEMEGKDVSDDEHAEIRQLAKKQEEIYRKISDQFFYKE